MVLAIGFYLGYFKNYVDDDDDNVSNLGEYTMHSASAFGWLSLLICVVLCALQLQKLREQLKFEGRLDLLKVRTCKKILAFSIIEKFATVSIRVVLTTRKFHFTFDS